MTKDKKRKTISVTKMSYKLVYLAIFMMVVISSIGTVDAATATAVAKTIRIPIPGSGGFTININNPAPNDIHVYMSAARWTGPVPDDTITGILDGAVLIPAGGTVSVEFPRFRVGAGAKPDTYPIEIQWTVQETGEVITTDPYVKLYIPMTVTGGYKLTGPFIAVFLIIFSLLAMRKNKWVECANNY